MPSHGSEFIVEVVRRLLALLTLQLHPLLEVRLLTSMSRIDLQLDYFSTPRDSSTPDPEDFLNMVPAPVANMGGSTSMSPERATAESSHDIELDPAQKASLQELERRNFRVDGDYTPPASKRRAGSIETISNKRQKSNIDMPCGDKGVSRYNQAKAFEKCKPETQAQRRKFVQQISSVWGR